MTPKSYKKSVFNLNDVYEEEIPVELLENKEDPTIKYKKGFDIILFIIFFFCLALLGGSIYYAFGNRDKNVDVNITKEQGEIAIFHSKIDLGLTINSFLKFNSKDTASSYNFYIENENDYSIGYKIKINSLNIKGKDKIKINYLEYSLIKNNTEVARGNLAQINDNTLVNETIKGKDKDMYTLKIWSNTPSNNYYKYEIEVE